MYQPLDLFAVDQKIFLSETGTHQIVYLVKKLNDQDKLYGKNHPEVDELGSVLHRGIGR